MVITQDVNFAKIDRKRVSDVTDFKTQPTSYLKRMQQKETVKRYQFINNVLKQGLTVDREAATDLRSRLDRVLIHKVWGYAIFFIVLMTIFQAIFHWSSIPQDFIDSSFVSLSESLKNNLPEGVFTNLLTEGISFGLRRNCHIHPSNSIFIFIHFHFRGKWIYEPRGIFNGSRVTTFWIKW